MNAAENVPVSNGSFRVSGTVPPHLPHQLPTKASAGF